jgi:hypothetical protein
MKNSNALYASVEHFRKETKIQAKFFKKLSLNEYRKAIAERYGFKGIKLFEESLGKIIVTVVAYETLDSSGGFDWYELQEDALANYEHGKIDDLEYNTQNAIFDVLVSSHEAAEDEIEKMDYAGLMDNAKIMFPYPPEIWKEIVTSHNKEEVSKHFLSPEQLKILKKMAKQKELVDSAYTIFKGEGSVLTSEEYEEYMERSEILHNMCVDNLKSNLKINKDIIVNVIGENIGVLAKTVDQQNNLKLQTPKEQMDKGHLIHTNLMNQELIYKHQEFAKSIGGTYGYLYHTDTTQRYTFDDIDQKIKFQEYLKENNIPYKLIS